MLVLGCQIDGGALISGWGWGFSKIHYPGVCLIKGGVANYDEGV